MCCRVFAVRRKALRICRSDIRANPGKKAKLLPERDAYESLEGDSVSALTEALPEGDQISDGSVDMASVNNEQPPPQC